LCVIYVAMVPKLFVRAYAEQRNMNLSQFQYTADLSMGTARRLWYSTSDGKAEGPALRAVNLDSLERAAQCLGVSVAELFVGPGGEIS